VTVTTYFELELDQKVIDAVDDSWRDQFYSDVKSAEDVAEHVGGVMARDNVDLSMIDGFADLRPDLARMRGREWEAEAREIKPRPRARKRARGRPCGGGG
jgi:hypothetical protein